MKAHGYYCPGCKGQVVVVGEVEIRTNFARHSAEKMDLDSAIFNLFNFLVCAGCGLTSLQANPRMRSIAEELIEDRGGHS